MGEKRTNITANNVKLQKDKKKTRQRNRKSKGKCKLSASTVTVSNPALSIEEVRQILRPSNRLSAGVVPEIANDWNKSEGALVLGSSEEGKSKKRTKAAIKTHNNSKDSKASGLDILSLCQE